MKERFPKVNPWVHYYLVTDNKGVTRILLLHEREAKTLERYGDTCVKVCASHCVGGM